MEPWFRHIYVQWHLVCVQESASIKGISQIGNRSTKLVSATCVWWPGNNRSISTGISSGAVYIAFKEKSMPLAQAGHTEMRCFQLCKLRMVVVRGHICGRGEQEFCSRASVTRVGVLGPGGLCHLGRGVSQCWTAFVDHLQKHVYPIPK